MTKKLLPYLLTAFMSMVWLNAFAYDIAVKNSDGVTIYYAINNGEAYVTYRIDPGDTAHGSYSGNIIIPESVEYGGKTYRVVSIGSEAFSNSTYLTSVIIPNSVTSIGDEAFEFCSGLTSVIIPNSVTSIGARAFAGCSGLPSVTIPNSVTFIGSSAFSGCSGLPSVTIPNSVTFIGSYAFSGCSGLPSITIPNSVKSIGDGAFAYCSGLESIKVESGNQKYDSRNNCNAIIEASLNTLITGCKNSTIPNSVESIGSSAFYGCSGLTSVTIPNSVTSIGSYAFYGCSGLTTITIPNGVESVGDLTFDNCSGLTSVTIPNSVTSIGGSAFSGCKGLTTIISEKENPFEIDSYTFDPDTYKVAELIVPKGTKAAYQSTAGWNQFQNIVEASGGEEPMNNPSTHYSGQYLYFYSKFFRRYTFNGTPGNESIQYALEVDPDNWRTLARGESVEVEGGDGIYWKGNLTPDPYYGIGHFDDGGEPFEIYGNIMSLLYGDDFIGKTSLGGKDGAFRELFMGCTYLVSAENLVLPATTLSARCYLGMFEGCTSLGTAPELPAITLASNCYDSMFEGCSFLTTAPALPGAADPLAPNCYRRMFKDCTALTTAPELLTKKLGEACYEYMFYGCTSLTYVKCLATDISDHNCTIGWLYGVSSSGTFVKDSSMNDWPRGASGIPEGWTIQNDNESSSEKDEVAFAIDGTTYQGTKSEKTVVVKAVDTSRTWMEIPASVSYDGMTYQVTGIADGVFDGSSMAALIWNVESALTNSAFNNASIGSNFLLYVKSSSYAPSSVKNVVVDGTAQTIVLSDDGGQFYCPQTFTARSISYTHNYSMETGIGKAKGWETIALPFDVQKISHNTRGEIVPFPAYNSSSNQKPFWLANFSGSSFRRTAAVLANEPYIIAMPNSSSYRNEYNLAGDVTFSADNVQVPKTPSFSGTFMPAFATVAKSSSVYAMNVNNRSVKYSGSYDAGSRFISGLREVHPFEAYMTGSFSRGVIEINFDDGTTSLNEELRMTNEESAVATDGEIVIYTLSGQQVARTSQRDFDTVWQQLPKGVYLVNGKKLIK